MFRRVVLLILLSIGWPFSVTFGAVDLYSETVILGRENALQNLVRLRAPLFGTELSPYLGLGSEVLNNQKGLDRASSYFFAGPGVRYAQSGFQALVELRGRSYYETAKARKLDLRGLTTYGHFWSTPFEVDSPFSWMAEFYSEGLFTSADFENVILTTFLRPGFRYQPEKRSLFATDLFVEPFVTLDRNRHFYNNRADLKPTIRVRFGEPSLMFHLSVSYVFNRYFERGNAEPNPFSSRNRGVRLLLAIGGSF